MVLVQRHLEKICQTSEIPLLLCGAPGTGKEVMARWVHQRSMHAAGQFVKISCGAIPGTLLESELFGYERGAFTGATTTRPGWVEMAHLGTLFLDEISALEFQLQAKLLQFLQDGQFSRLGSHDQRTVKVQIISSSNRDLGSDVRSGRFRADLYYRLSALQVKLPTLEDRRDDIPSISQYLLSTYQRQFGKAWEPLSSELMAYLTNLKWPGNIRELANSMARYALIGQDAFPVPEPGLTRNRKALTLGDSTLSLKRVTGLAIRQVERAVILEALRSNKWNRRRTAEQLKISYRALIYKIRDSGLVSSNPRRSRNTISH